MKSAILYIILYLFFFLTPMESISLIQGGHFSLPKLSVIFLFAAFVMSSHIRKLRRSKFIGMFAVYFIWAFISAVFSINIEGAILRCLSFLIPLLILLYILNALIVDERIIRNIMISFIIGCCVPVVIMMNFMVNGVGGNLDRMTALEQDQNELSVMLCIAVSFVFILLKQIKNKWARTLLITFICLSLIAILLTGSRTGFIILLGVSLLGLLSLGKKSLVWIVLLGIIIIPMLLPYIPESNIERLLQTQEQLAEGDLTGRGYIWDRALNAFHNQAPIRMIIGVGYDQFPFLYNQSYGTFSAPHNTYLATFVEQGLIGCIILLYILIFTFKKAFVLCRRNQSLAYLGMLIPVLLAMMTLGLQTRRWLWIILLLIYIMYKISLNQKETR